MSAAQSPQVIVKPDRRFSSRPAKTALAFVIGTALTVGLAQSGVDDGHAASILVAIPPERVVAVAALSHGDAPTVRDRAAGIATGAALPRSEQPALVAVWAPAPFALRADQLRPSMARAAAAPIAAAVAQKRDQSRPRFAAAYRSMLKLAALHGLQRLQQDAELTQTIVGIASTYNPYRDGIEEGGLQTASGERYDPAAWTAAIQINLRAQFGGVRYGRNYRPAYALVESDGRQIIVKINDVGPLRAGRVIDLNERSMRYFDPTLRRGLLRDVKLTLLPGDDWTPGPIGGVQLAGML